MLDYSRISKVMEYHNKGIWPHKNMPEGFIHRLKDAVRIILTKNAKGNPLDNIFRGTRYWEYPWVLEQLSRLPRGSIILDCGCGMSAFPEELSHQGYRPTGLDFFVGAKRKNPAYGITDRHIKKLRGKVDFLNGTLEKIPAPDNSFDAVTCVSVMEHIVIENRYNPEVHLRCLDEMKRVLKPGGLLICTYDTILNPEVVYSGTKEWGPNGWYYLDDIDYLQMHFLNPTTHRVTREEIMTDEDTFFVPADIYFLHGYGAGFEKFGSYHRLTSVGFTLVKP